MARTKKLTEAEQYFIKAHAEKLSVKLLSQKLSISEASIRKYMKEADIKEKIGKFDQKSGVTVMTQSQSAEDDKIPKTSLPSRHEDSIYRPYGD